MFQNNKIKDYLKLIRIKQWLKNGLIFLPIFFSKNIINTKLLYLSLIAFIIFSLVSSIVYIINDINDLEKDKLHPIKKNRPLAAEKISVKEAKVTIGIISILAILMSIYGYIKINNIFVFIIPIIYLILNILYSKKLKNIPIIDIIILVSGFILRIIYGGIITSVEISNYLLLMIFFGASYMGFGKRRNEIIKNGNKSRKVLEYYNKDFLDKNMYVCFSLAIVSYTLWCFDPNTIARIGNEYAFWTIPIVMVILQKYSLNVESNSHGDPIEIILNDKGLIIAVIIYILAIGGILYLL